MAGEGKGWHGDSQGHAHAGRKGGLARSKNLRERRESELVGSNQFVGEDMDVSEEERIRAEIKAYQDEIVALRARESANVVAYQIDQLENELRSLQEQVDQSSQDSMHDLHVKVHDLGNRIHSFARSAP